MSTTELATSDNETALTTAESETLAEHEALIEAGMRSFINVGRALLAIRDQRLYREKFPTFEAYLAKRWGIGRSTGYQMIAAAEVVEDVRNCGQTETLPANEAQARELTTVPRADRAEVWTEAVETAPTDGDGKPVVTAKHVQGVVNRRSDARVKAVLWKGLGACTDKESAKYALGCVELRPAGEGTVFCAATDGRVLAVARTEGVADGTHLVPAEILPKNGRSVSVGLHDLWERKNGDSVVSVPPAEGTFPSIADALPALEAGRYHPVTFNAKLLANLAQAINSEDVTGVEGGGVTLFVPLDDTGTGIPVVGSHGIGVVMPFADDTHSSQKYTGAREKYIAACQDAATPAPPPARTKKNRTTKKAAPKKRSAKKKTAKRKAAKKKATA